jgi:putative phosphoesterase
MKIGFFSDAHGNPWGVEICLDYFRRLDTDEILFLGDAVGYFPDAKRTIDLLETSSVKCLVGNHDAMLLGHLPLDSQSEAVYRIAETRERLHSSYLEKMASWLLMEEMEIENRKILCVHGSPWNPLNGYVYPDSDIGDFSHLPFDIVMTAHTHRAFVRRSGPVVVVNVGSCSLPRDHGNQSSCAVYDSREHTIRIVRIPFDEEEWIDRYEDSIHASVADALRRKSKSAVAERMTAAL